MSYRNVGPDLDGLGKKQDLVILQIGNRHLTSNNRGTVSTKIIGYRLSGRMTMTKPASASRQSP